MIKNKFLICVIFIFEITSPKSFWILSVELLGKSLRRSLGTFTWNFQVQREAQLSLI